MTKLLLRRLLLPLLALLFCLPAQAGMVGTVQIRDAAVGLPAAAVAEQRDWIFDQLVKGGVERKLADRRVAAMTDAQVAELHQRIDEAPAGGVEPIVILIIVFVVTEYMGYTDIIPD